MGWDDGELDSANSRYLGRMWLYARNGGMDSRTVPELPLIQELELHGGQGNGLFIQSIQGFLTRKTRRLVPRGHGSAYATSGEM